MTMIPGQQNDAVAKAFVSVFSWLFKRSRLEIKGGNTVDAPIIMSSGMGESSAILGAAKGKLAGYDYVLLANSMDRVMLNVTLPRNTGLHIIAIGDKSHNLDEGIRFSQRKWLEPVSLEGNFPDRFEMYVSKDRQMEVRQLFEPDVMMNFYNLCRSYDFELFHESIYFSEAERANDSNDTTSMVTDAEAFLQENAAFFNRL
jgi:hypothetical protein